MCYRVSCLHNEFNVFQWRVCECTRSHAVMCWCPLWWVSFVVLVLVFVDRHLINLPLLLQVLWIWWVLSRVCIQDIGNDVLTIYLLCIYLLQHIWDQCQWFNSQTCCFPWCVLHRTGDGLPVRLPDWGHDVVDHRVLAHHFSKCHRPRDFPHLWRCSSRWPAG